MFKKIKEIKKSNKLKSINDYQWLALDFGTENFKARYINTGENVIINRAVRDGTIVADPDALQRILPKIFQYFKLEIKNSKQMDNNSVKDFKELEKIDKKRDLIVLMTTPNEVNTIQRKALENIVHQLGALRSFVQKEVKMAALGSGQDIFGTAIMCINIGGRSTDIAVINNDSILYSYTTHCAGDFLTQKIKEYIAKKHAIKIGTKEAENVLKNIGSLIKYTNEKSYTISGISLPRLDSQPGETMSISKTIEITPEEIRENIMEVEFKEHVIPAIRTVLRTVEDKATRNVSDLKKKGKGITICGGGTYIKKIDEFIKTELSKEYFIEVKSNTKPIRQKYEGDIFEVRVAENPLNNVIDGCVKYRDTVYKQIIAEQNPNREILKKEYE